MKKNIVCYCFVFICLATQLFAQPEIVWDRTYGAISVETFYDVKQIHDNGYILSGETQSANISGFHDMNDAILIRLNEDGDTLWARAFGSTSGREFAFSVIQDKDLNFVFTSWAFVFTAGGDIASPIGFSDMWVAKIDTSGNLLWEKSLGTTAFDEGKAIVEAHDSGYISVGYTSGNIDVNNGGEDFYLVKLSPAGNIIWEKTYGGSLDETAYSILATSDNNYLILGETFSTDLDVSNNHGNKDIWVIKIDNNGDTLWTRTYGGSANDGVRAVGGHTLVAESTDGFYYIGGYSTSNDFDVWGNSGQQDFWIAKINTINGDTLWTRSLGGSKDDYAMGIYSTCDGGCVISGDSYSDTASGLKTENNPGFMAEALWIVRLDADGNILWDKTIGSAGVGHDEESKFFPTIDGGYASLITSKNPPNPQGEKTAPLIGNDDFWMLKFDYLFDFKADTACIGDTTYFTNLSVSMIDSIQWDFGDSTSGINNFSNIISPAHVYTQSGNFKTMTIVYKDCKQDTLLIDILVRSPLLFLNQDTTICLGDSTVIGPDSLITGVSYAWTPAITLNDSMLANPVATPVSKTLYRLTADDNGCIDTDSVLVSIYDAISILIINDTSLCIGDTILLFVDGGLSANEFIWNPPDGLSDTSIANPLANPLQTTYYYVYVNSSVCPQYQKTDSVLLLVDSLPAVSTGLDTMICLGDTIVLLANGADEYYWIPNNNIETDTSNNPLVFPTSQTQYIVSGKNVLTGCSNSDSIVISVAQASVNLGKDTFICMGQSIMLNISTSATQVLWFNGDTTFYTLISDTGNVWLMILQENCLAYDSINVGLCPNLYIPNAFSPNGDGKNDIFRIRGDGIENILIKIYDRWGNRIFETIDKNTGWGGLINGKPASEGVYVYLIIGNFIDDNEIDLKGNITLIR